MRRTVLLLVSALVLGSVGAAPAASADPPPVLDHDTLLAGLAEPEWYEANIPFLEVPDRELQDVYYYRWSTYKRHLRYTDRANGYVVTEFHNPPGYSAPLGGIVAAAGHHIAEGRWLRDRRPLDDYVRYWLRGPGASEKPREDYVNEDTDDWAHQYSFWAASSVYQRYLVTGDRSVTNYLPDLVRQYDKWAPQFNPGLGLYWSVPVWDAMEYTASAHETDPADPYHGGHGYRPTLNSYQYGDAQAIAAIARLAGRGDIARDFSGRADALAAAMHRHLWDDDRKFFYHKARADLDPSESLVTDREQIGFLPWAFGADRPSDDVAWSQLLSPDGFAAPYGPTTVERRSQWFMYEAAGCCRWNGPSWPFSTSQTLTGLANLLNTRTSPYVTSADYYSLLRTYALTQYKDGRPYVAEAHHPLENRWLYDGRGHSEHYNHSTFTDLVINGLVGVRPGDPLTVNPLVPASWDYFALENVPYRGHDVTVLWDRTGSRYHRGAGLQVLVDGRKVASRASLGPLRVPVGTVPVPVDRSVNDAANPAGSGYPRPFASYTNGLDSTWDAVDGRIYYDDIPHSRWTNYQSPNAADHLGVDFGVPTPVSDVRLYLYDDGGGVQTPAGYEVEFWTGADWRPVPGQTRTPLAGNTMNRITFPAVTTTQLRVMFTNRPGAYVGVTELGVWSPTAGALTVTPTSSTYGNTSGRAERDVRVRLAVPPGWSATALSSAHAKVVRPGGSFTTRWRVTPPSAVRPGDYPIRAFTSTTASEYGTVTIPFDPAAYPVSDLVDDFTGDHAVHQPSPAEALPAVTTSEGRFTASGTAPYFGLVASPVGPSSGDAASVLTVGSFAGTGAPEDSVFVGWVLDRDNYVTAWYNHTRKSSGLNVRVGGRDLNTPGDAAVTLAPGDRFALAVDGDTLTSYARTAGGWRSLRSATVGAVVTPEHRYGFGVRATTGAITVTGLSGLAMG